MTNQQLYETIFKRRSIRKFDKNSLPEETLSMVKQYAANVKPLDASIRYEFSFLTGEEVKNILPIKAPHYISIYSEKKDNYLMNVGFLLQQIDLFLSANHIASCWLGMAKPNHQVPDSKNGLDFVIMLAFGNSSEPIHRTSTSEFNRKKLSDITSIKDADELLEPVRLAPSASNTQTWYFSGGKEEIVISREKLSLLRAPLYGKFNQVDTGIALCHLWLALQLQGKDAKFDYSEAEVPKGYEFMVKVKV